MARGPLLPRSKTNPVGQTQPIRKARAVIFKSLRQAQQYAVEEVMSWPYTIRNQWHANKFYEFQVSQTRLEQIVTTIARIVSEGGGPDAVRDAVARVYEGGAVMSMENLFGQSDDIARAATAPIADTAVRRRASIAGARAYEEMQGFTDDLKKDLSRVMFNAIQSGENPRQTAKIIRGRFDVSRSRAERIARTEITMALRRGGWDADRDMEEKFGLRSMLLHNSALIPGRTRESHARRHGKLYTREEVTDWYSRDANAINCLCSQTAVIVDENGEPVFGDKLRERMAVQREKLLAKDDTA